MFILIISVRKLLLGYYYGIYLLPFRITVFPLYLVLVINLLEGIISVLGTKVKD